MDFDVHVSMTYDICLGGYEAGYIDTFRRMLGAKTSFCHQLSPHDQAITSSITLVETTVQNDSWKDRVSRADSSSRIIEGEPPSGSGFESLILDSDGELPSSCSACKMSFFFPEVEAVRLWLGLLGLNTFWQYIHDLWGSYLDTFRQRDLIHPWYGTFSLLCIKVVVVGACGYGRNRDSRPVNDESVIVTGKKRSYVLQLDRDKNSRELRMGIFGQPEPSGMGFSAVERTPPDQSPRRLRIAVICPVYLSDSVNDVVTLERLQGCLQSQDLQAALIVLVDDFSPVMSRSSQDGKPAGKDTPPGDPYELLDLPKATIPTLVLRLSENLGPDSARNAGIDRAIAELGNQPGNTILFLTDLDCLPPRDWVRNGYQAILDRRPSLETHNDLGVDPLIIGGITSSAESESPIYSYYHDFYGTLNPRVWVTTYHSSATVHPLYVPSCNMAIYPGSNRSGKRLPRFHEGFREPSMEDVLFCLEAVFRRGCDLGFDKVSICILSSYLSLLLPGIDFRQNLKMSHVHREGLIKTWNTFRKVNSPR